MSRAFQGLGLAVTHQFQFKPESVCLKNCHVFRYKLWKLKAGNGTVLWALGLKLGNKIIWKIARQFLFIIKMRFKRRNCQTNLCEEIALCIEMWICMVT
jgi:hypothetical protein